MNEMIRSIPEGLVPGLILVVSVLAVAIIVDRSWLLLFKIKGIDPALERKLLDLLRQHKLTEAMDICKQEKNAHPAFLVAATLIESAILDLNYKAIMEAEIHRTTHQLKRFLPGLGTISTIAPLLGLLGTVTGMIKSFHAFDANNAQNAQLVGGIDEALITTTLGLIVAIPALIAYNHLANRVNAIAEETYILSEQIATQLSQE